MRATKRFFWWILVGTSGGLNRARILNEIIKTPRNANELANLLKLDYKTNKDEVAQKFIDDPRVAVTHKKAANLVFSFGREHGHYGRLLDQTVIVLPTIHVLNDNEVIGFCFTPQDGNSILSSIAATERFLFPDSYEEKLHVLGAFLLQEV